MPFKIHTDLELLKANLGLAFSPILYPSLGLFPEAFHDPKSPMRDRFDKWLTYKEEIQITDLENCDCAVYPFEWYSVSGEAFAVPSIEQFASLASTAGKLAILFAYGDQHVEFPNCPNLVILQSNLTKTCQARSHFCHPTMIEDFPSKYSANQAFEIRPRKRPFWRRTRPVISFQGLSSSSQLRQQTLDALKKSHLVKSRFNLMPSYFGGAWSRKLNGFDFSQLEKIRRSYAENLLSSEYVLCVRGYGNYSARFYETLCCGRIPLVVDSDCSFPFEEQTQIRTFIPIISANEVNRIDRFIADFDNSLSDDDFASIQLKCRQVWSDFYSPEGFLSRIVPHVLSQLANETNGS